MNEKHMEEQEDQMEEIRQGYYTGERPLFGRKNLRIYDTIFGEGESPLKESRNIELYNSMFQWKYPLWYARDILVKDTTWFEMARAGVWYTDHIRVEDCAVEAPKNFRRCHDLTLKNVSIPNGAESLWQCEGAVLEDVVVKGDYFAMNCSDLDVRRLTLYGNYSFDGAKNVEVRDSKLLSKDAFWNTENVTVHDSFISGEYLGWNAKNLTLIGCTIESLQGMCYIDNLVMKNCKLLNTTLAFEYSTVEAQIDSGIKSVFNPSGGSIQAEYIEELILENDRIDPSKTRIVCRRSGREE